MDRLLPSCDYTQNTGMRINGSEFLSVYLVGRRIEEEMKVFSFLLLSLVAKMVFRFRMEKIKKRLSGQISLELVSSLTYYVIELIISLLIELF